jgi:hypothetical protein
MINVKRALDPHMIMNPRKLFRLADPAAAAAASSSPLSLGL